MGKDEASTRREFLSGGGRAPGRLEMRTGRHGEKVSLLGYGAMRLPTVDGAHATGRLGGKPAEGFSTKSIDQAMVNAHVDYMLAHGVNYFDTSPVYCRGESERVMGEALSRHPRGSYFLATKLSNFNETYWKLPKAKEMFENSMKSLRTDYFDFYLLHSIGNGGLETFRRRYIDNGALEWLLAERKAGRIRNLGFSFHGDSRAFEWCMENHDRCQWDFCQIQMNYVDWRHAKEVNARNLDASYLYKTLAAKDIPVVVMEPLLGGRLARFNYAISAKLKGLDPDASLASWAFRFCGSHPKVLTILSGMTYKSHIVENIATLSPLKPLTAKEMDVLEDVARLMLQGKTVPCNLCQYCMPCPYGIDIPGVFDCWNSACTDNRLPDDPAAPGHAANRRRFLMDYDSAIPHLRQAEHCIGCGRCVAHCPQRIDIPLRMADIDIQVAEWRKEERHVR
ncbi:MAG: aldo/keto reductase [Kiritimatiellae bacterium]|nr:aldo/keto reductase [Kiritimatiellia bacterium]